MKKIKLLATFVLMIITMTTFTMISRATTGKVNDNEIKIRREPKETSTIIDLLNEGDEVEILEQLDGWYKVKAKTELGKITGYVVKELVDVEEKTNQDVEKEETVGEKVEQTPIVQQNIEIKEDSEYTLVHEIKIKSLPLIYSTAKSQITGNIKIVEIINDWARVESDTSSGWIRNNLLKGALITTEEVVTEEPKTESEPQPKPETQPEKVPETKPEKQEEIKEPEITEMNKVGYVKTEGLKVRKGPSTNYEEITSLSKNYQVKITGKTGNWYRINLNGQVAYLSAKYISDTKVPETTSRDGSTLKNETPQVTTPSTPEKTEQPVATGISGVAVVEYAKQYLGCNYVSGGTTPTGGFDCSGFTKYVYKNFGITLNRISRDQFKNGVAVQKSDLQPGDLVMFNNGGNTAINHVGIYIGDGNFIHASNPKTGVKISPLTSSYYQVRYVGARRVI